MEQAPDPTNTVSQEVYLDIVHHAIALQRIADAEQFQADKEEALRTLSRVSSGDEVNLDDVIPYLCTELDISQEYIERARRLLIPSERRSLEVFEELGITPTNDLRYRQLWNIERTYRQAILVKLEEDFPERRFFEEVSGTKQHGHQTTSFIRAPFISPPTPSLIQRIFSTTETKDEDLASMASMVGRDYIDSLSKHEELPVLRLKFKINSPVFLESCGKTIADLSKEFSCLLTGGEPTYEQDFLTTQVLHEYSAATSN